MNTSFFYANATARKHASRKEDMSTCCNGADIKSMVHVFYGHIFTFEIYMDTNNVIHDAILHKVKNE
jgi:hypothetical protein